MVVKLKVSIIVAAFNEENRIKTCLDSLINQTLKQDFEVIVINDGSSDQTGKICDEYTIKYPSIVTVIHQSNKGQGLARNTGIRCSKGAYIGFVDADDYVDSNMFEVMHESAIKNHADVVVCDVHKVYEGENRETKQHSLQQSQDIIDIGAYIKEGIDNAYACN